MSPDQVKDEQTNDQRDNSTEYDGQILCARLDGSHGGRCSRARIWNDLITGWKLRGSCANIPDVLFKIRRMQRSWFATSVFLASTSPGKTASALTTGTTTAISFTGAIENVTFCKWATHFTIDSSRATSWDTLHKNLLHGRFLERIITNTAKYWLHLAFDSIAASKHHPCKMNT